VVCHVRPSFRAAAGSTRPQLLPSPSSCSIEGLGLWLAIEDRGTSGSQQDVVDVMREVSRAKTDMSLSKPINLVRRRIKVDWVVEARVTLPDGRTVSSGGDLAVNYPARSRQYSAITRPR
jgi:hypothetical protein